MHNAPNIPDAQFTAMTRLDHNRAIAQLAQKTSVSVNEIKHMTIWGNHSATQYPDLFHADVAGQNAAALVNDQQWLENDFIPTVQQRGAAIIDARGAALRPRPHRLQLTICGTGRWALLKGIGSRWRSHRLVITERLRASLLPSPVPPVEANTKLYSA